MNFLTPIFVVGFIVLGIYKLFELFVRRKERMILIEKLPEVINANEVGIKFPEISFGKRDYGSWALRFALLLVGVGLGCLLAFIVQCGLQYSLFDLSKLNMDDWHVREEISNLRFVLYFSFIAIFGGLSLFAAYLIERKQTKKQRDLVE